MARNLKVLFKITNNRKIVLLYFGLQGIKTKPVKKDLQEFFSFVEVDYLEGKANKHRGLKHFQTSYSETYHYISHKVIDIQNGKELIIKTKNDVLEVETHYRFYKDVQAVSCFNIVKNICKSPLFLTFISSFHQLGILPINDKNINEPTLATPKANTGI